MADLSSFTNIFYSWIKSSLFWIIVTFILTASAVFILVYRKKKKLKYNCLEIVHFGNGKIGINKTKAGLFGDKKALGGLLDYGMKKVFKTKEGKTIFDASTEDLHDLFGKKGFLVKRKDDDPAILVPLSKFEIKNDELLAEIAPADFRDASVAIFRDMTKETMGWAEKYMPYIMLAGIIIFFVVAMLLASQFFSRTVDKASELLLQAGENAGNVAPSGAP